MDRYGGFNPREAPATLLANLRDRTLGAPEQATLVQGRLPVWAFPMFLVFVALGSMSVIILG